MSKAVGHIFTLLVCGVDTYNIMELIIPCNIADQLSVKRGAIYINS